MALDKNEVDRLAKLSRLYFTEEEKVTFVQEFNAILEQVKVLDNINVDDVDLTTSGDVLLATQLRQDCVEDSLSQSAILYNSPRQSQGAFLVPITVDEEGQH